MPWKKVTSLLGTGHWILRLAPVEETRTLRPPGMSCSTATPVSTSVGPGLETLRELLRLHLSSPLLLGFYSSNTNQPTKFPGLIFTFDFAMPIGWSLKFLVCHSNISFRWLQATCPASFFLSCSQQSCKPCSSQTNLLAILLCFCMCLAFYWTFSYPFCFVVSCSSFTVLPPRENRHDRALPLLAPLCMTLGLCTNLWHCFISISESLLPRGFLALKW